MQAEEAKIHLPALWVKAEAVVAVILLHSFNEVQEVVEADGVEVAKLFSSICDNFVQ